MLVRVRLDWSGLQSRTTRVSHQVVGDLTDTLHWYTPWYLGKDGSETGHEDPSGQPIPLRELPETWRRLRSTRRRRVQNLIESFESGPQPIQIVTLTYAVGNGSFLILDRNHRLAALTLKPLDFRVLQINIEGPLDPDLLPDLRYWQRE